VRASVGGNPWDDPPRRSLYARADSPGEGLLVERRHEHAIGDDLLDLVEQRLALLAIELIRLALKEIFDLGHDTIRVGTVLGEERLEAGRGIARGAGGPDEEPRDLLLSPRGEEGGTLHGAHPAADADGLEIAGDGLGHGGVGRERREVARVEAIGMARFDHEPLRALG